MAHTLTLANGHRYMVFADGSVSTYVPPTAPRVMRAGRAAMWRRIERNGATAVAVRLELARRLATKAVA